MDGKEPDVSKSFLIVSRAIERMAASPTKSQIKMINKIAEMIAINQSLDERKSNYKGVYYHSGEMKYFTELIIKGKKKRMFGSDTDKECFEKLKEYKLKIKGNGK